MARVKNPDSAKWRVYVHKNRENGKVYVGKTCRKPEYRWNDGKGYQYQHHFWHAIQKYGWDSFDHTIVAEDLSADAAKELEIQLIAEYGSMDPDKGYNQTAGGEGMLGWHHTEHSRARIIESNKTRGVSEETKQKQRESHKGRYGGEKNPFYGKTHTEAVRRRISEANTGRSHEMSEEARRKISESKKGKYTGENAPWYGRKHTEEQKQKIGRASKRYQNLPEVKAKKSAAVSGENNPMYGKIPSTAMVVCQYTKSGEFVAEYPSATHAKRATGISNVSIGSCCKGTLKSAGGFVWKYKASN